MIDRMRVQRTLLTAIGVLAVVLVATAGCSSGSRTSTTTSTAAAGAGGSTSPTAGAASSGTFCQQYFAIIDNVSARSFTADGFEQLKSSYQSMAASAPPAIQSEVNSLNATVQAASNAESLPATSPAQTSVDTFVQANCSQSSTSTTTE
jgi:hypothetical protein